MLASDIRVVRRNSFTVDMNTIQRVAIEWQEGVHPTEACECVSKLLMEHHANLEKRVYLTGSLKINFHLTGRGLLKFFVTKRTFQKVTKHDYE